MSRQRTALSWSPTWEGPISGWAANFIRKNMWRCDKIHEFDDLLQDAYLLFIKVCERYPRIMEPRHFMALFKSSLSNQIHDHARYVKRKRVTHVDTSQDVSDLYSDHLGEFSNYGYLQAALAEAPEELKLALALFEQEPERLCANHPEGKRENLNAQLRRILGVDDFDFTTGLKNLLEQTQ